MFESVDDIIEALGGTNSVADTWGLNPSVVSSWRLRKSIPGVRWLAVADLARERGVEGITVEMLAALHSRSGAVEVRV